MNFPGGPGGSTSGSDSLSTARHKNTAGPIAGGVVSALVIVGLIAGGAYYFFVVRRRRLRKMLERDDGADDRFSSPARIERVGPNSNNGMREIEPAVVPFFSGVGSGSGVGFDNAGGLRSGPAHLEGGMDQIPGPLGITTQMSADNLLPSRSSGSEVGPGAYRRDVKVSPYYAMQNSDGYGDWGSGGGGGGSTGSEGDGDGQSREFLVPQSRPARGALPPIPTQMISSTSPSAELPSPPLSISASPESSDGLRSEVDNLRLEVERLKAEREMEAPPSYVADRAPF